MLGCLVCGEFSLLVTFATIQQFKIFRVRTSARAAAATTTTTAAQAPRSSISKHRHHRYRTRHARHQHRHQHQAVHQHKYRQNKKKKRTITSHHRQVQQEESIKTGHFRNLCIPAYRVYTPHARVTTTSEVTTLLYFTTPTARHEAVLLKYTHPDSPAPRIQREKQACQARPPPVTWSKNPWTNKPTKFDQPPAIHMTQSPVDKNASEF